MDKEITSQHFTSKFLKTPSFGHSNYKIMVVMHGLGDQLDSYEPLVLEINVTGVNYLLINAPMDYPIGYSWYDLPPEDPRPSIDASVFKLKLLIDELLEAGFQYDDIFVMGFSQGGAMAFELANSLDRPLAGILALSPRIYFETDQLSECIKNTPVYSGHGRYDDVIPFSETASSLNKMREQVKDFSFSQFDMGHEICYDEIVEIRNWLNERL